MDLKKLSHLLEKYNKAGHRYTLFPILKDWSHHIPPEHWFSSLRESHGSEIDLYIHLPFCKSLCTFCGCNIHVSKDPQIQEIYVNALLKELDLYQKESINFSISQIYLGGGTPTFLSDASLNNLLEGISKRFKFTDDFFGTVESDPRLKQSAQLKTLRRYHFTRISFGVQDFNQKVLTNINREQSFDQVKKQNDEAKTLGFQEIFYDFIYGLPYQKPETLFQGLTPLKDLNPSGIAFYPLAHVPWQKNIQNAFGTFIPVSTKDKLQMKLEGGELFKSQGLLNIGMGHFLSPSSRTGKSFLDGKLRRSIMGLVPKKSKITLGIGASAISQTGSILSQNAKVLQQYLAMIDKGELPVQMNHLQSSLESEMESLFESIYCQGIIPKEVLKKVPTLDKILGGFINDGILEFKEDLKLTELGRFFIKNVDQAIELGLQKNL